jgi:hypothetical protein
VHPTWLTYNPATRDISVETTDLAHLGSPHLIWIEAKILEHPGPTLDIVFFWNIVNEGITLPTTSNNASINPTRTTDTVDLNLVTVWSTVIGGTDFPNATSAQLITTDYDEFILFDSTSLTLRITQAGFLKYCSHSANKVACSKSQEIKLDIIITSIDPVTGETT